MSTWPSPRDQRLGIPDLPAIRFTRGNHFVAYTVRTFATACQFARPPARIRPVSQPSGTFTSRLPADWSPFPPLDMTTAVTGLLCWRDLHPQEWQLASLHDLVGSDAVRRQKNDASSPNVLLRPVPVCTDRFKQSPICGVQSKADPCAHHTDSHNARARGIHKGIHSSDFVH